jgi:hypothetical protein
MPNILGAGWNGGEPLVLEKICNGGEAAELAPVATSLLMDGPARRRQIELLRDLKERAIAPGATARAAQALLEFIARLEI